MRLSCESSVLVGLALAMALSHVSLSPWLDQQANQSFDSSLGGDRDTREQVQMHTVT